MFDDVLKTSKASKKNKVEEVKPTAVHASQKDATKTKDPIHEDMSAEVVTTTAPLVDERREAPKKRKSTGKRTDPTYKQVGAYVKKDTYLKIQKLLLDKPDKDFSDLVQELLSGYLDNQLTD